MASETDIVIAFGVFAAIMVIGALAFYLVTRK